MNKFAMAVFIVCGIFLIAAGFVIGKYYLIPISIIPFAGTVAVYYLDKPYKCDVNISEKEVLDLVHERIEAFNNGLRNDEIISAAIKLEEHLHGKKYAKKLNKYVRGA